MIKPKYPIYVISKGRHDCCLTANFLLKDGTDFHIVIDFTKLNPDEVYQELFASKKNLYNEGHKIKIRGISVECYVQDSNQPHVSLGEYSILKNSWVKIPSKRRANFDQDSTRVKYEKLKQVVEHALKSTDPKFISDVLLKIKRYRSAGLEKGGEFSPENLAYKAVRAQGAIDKLYKRRDLMHGKQLSIENTVIKEDRELTELVAQFKQSLNETNFDRIANSIHESKVLDKPTPTVEQIAKKHCVSTLHVKKQLVQGIQVEKEHTKSANVAKEIALDHLNEDPDYYTKLSQAQLEESKLANLLASAGLAIAGTAGLEISNYFNKNKSKQ
jgi:hypothetical protein